QCIATIATLTVLTLSVLLGQGTGGGALALLPATTVLATEHAWLAFLPPEGASAIIHRDTTHAAQMAATQRITAIALHQTGIVHHLIPEHDEDTPEPPSQAVAAKCATHLNDRRHQPHGPARVTALPDEGPAVASTPTG